MPELRIKNAALWEAVRQQQLKCRLQPTSDSAAALNQTHRRKFVLSGLLRCAVCGGAYTVVAKDRYGCATRVKSGTCGNGATIRRAALERRVLDALRDKMMAPDLTAAFIVASDAELESARAAEKRQQMADAAELVEVERKISGIIDAIERGAWSLAVKERLTTLENRKGAIVASSKIEPAPSNVVAIRPATVETYRGHVVDLVAALSDPEAQTEAVKALRSLIDRIVLTPDAQALTGIGLSCMVIWLLLSSSARR